MRNSHYLKHISLDTFKNRKIKLKGNSKDENWFALLQLYILSQLDCLSISDITQTDIRNILVSI
ncbi:hypothetical protein O9A_01074 [Bartonella koehlerae C-29]|uniref:Uncharacterized protein n=1 Tax=Bartonella koehlerae C-29 TaxID=1134510 RepID=A0A067WDI2_9HYPH|nr:hypothetical protein O9A_01074 [Bartonella koehlerae C-29]